MSTEFQDKMSNSKLWRQSVIERLGGVCVRCGFDDPRAIQIDHIHGGGNKEAKAFGFKKYEQMHDHIEDYQILCANCNWIKRSENKEVRVYDKKVGYNG